MNNSLLRIYFLRKVSLACAKHSPRARNRGRTYYTNFVGKASVRHIALSMEQILRGRLDLRAA